LPELGEPARVRIRRQPAAFGLPAEVVELLFGQAPFEERTCVDARRGVTLDEHLVAEPAVTLAAEEVVEADFVQRRRRRVRRGVAAEAVEAMVRAVDHRERVPTDEGADAALDVLVARE